MRIDRYEGGAREWDDFVRRQRGWTHFHLHGWKRLIEEVLGHDCTYLLIRNDAGDPVGALPLVQVKSRLFGHYLVSMPFLNYGGPLGARDAVQRLAAEAVRLAESSGADLLELRCRYRADLPLSVSHRKITVVLDLPGGDCEVLWKTLPAKVRSQVRRPRKEGMECRFGPDQVKPFHEVFARHMRDLGTPVLSRSLFEEIARSFPDDVRIGCVYHHGRPVAGGYGFRWSDEFEMTWASSLRSHSHMAPNMLLYWTFMERACAEGLRCFNFGRCTPGGGTHRFKGQWGSRDEPLWWYHSAPGAKVATPSASDGTYSLGSWLWRRLPVPVATLLGPRIVRLIP